jgi:hypothetical protein
MLPHTLNMISVGYTRNLDNPQYQGKNEIPQWFVLLKNLFIVSISKNYIKKLKKIKKKDI